MGQFFKSAPELWVSQEVKIPGVHEGSQEIRICPGREGGFEKRVGFQNRVSVGILPLFRHGYQVQKGAAPAQDAEERVQGAAGIGEGVKPLREAEPKTLGLWR